MSSQPQKGGIDVVVVSARAFRGGPWEVLRRASLDDLDREVLHEDVLRGGDTRRCDCDSETRGEEEDDRAHRYAVEPPGSFTPDGMRKSGNTSATGDA